MLSRELRFAHFSVKEYLVSGRVTKDSTFTISVESAHRLATRISLVYLLSWTNITIGSRGVSSIYSGTDKYSFLDYSAKNWYRHHIKGGNQSTENDDLIMTLFDPKSDSRLTRWLYLHNPDRTFYLGPLRIEEMNNEYATPLYYSSLLRLEHTTKWLLDGGADVNAEGGWYGNALQAAAYECHGLEVVKSLLEKGADINFQGGYYGNALQAASHHGHQEVVELLLENGAEINAQGGYFGNALQAAAYQGHQEVVKLLLGKGADVNAQGGEYKNALHAASIRDHKEIVELLQKNGAETNMLE
jgi:ankyrin repeat protein